MDKSQGFLTTHILDTANGCPANGVEIELFFLKNNDRQFLTSTVTNDDGRTDTPIIPHGELNIGTYELVFHMGKYFAGKAGGSDSPEVPFVDVVPIRFGIANEGDHYHVPLLASPFSFSTYRGS